MRLRALAAKAAVAVVAASAVVWAAHHVGGVYVRGGSMRPALCPGDLVVYRRGRDGIGEGAIVLVAHAGWPGGILHRVLAVGWDGRLMLRGDANPVPDRDPVDPVAVRGVALLVVPCGKAIDALRSLVRGWYDKASQRSYRGDDGEARRGVAFHVAVREGPGRLRGSHAAERPRFTPAAAHLREAAVEGLA